MLVNKVQHQLTSRKDELTNDMVQSTKRSSPSSLVAVARVTTVSHSWLVVLSIVVCQLLASPAGAYYNATKFRELVEHDTSNDDAVNMSTEELIVRSGFRYQDYYAVAGDGYITQLIRIINPRADPRQLKQPPVLMLHGSHMDTSMFVMSSSIQHHPEKYPRGPEDGPMTSWNRSLGFTLSNNGYDVWLLGSRGSNEENSYFTSKPKFYQAQQPHFKPHEIMKARSWTTGYWDYSLDELIKFELANQIDLVRNVTGSREFHYFSFSLTTMSSMAFLAENPAYAHDCRTFTQMAPVLAASHFSTINQIYWEKIVPHLMTRGIGFSPFYTLDDFFIKSLVFAWAQSSKLRYGLLYRLARILLGPSPKYHTNFEKNVIHHSIQPVSFKAAQQYALTSKAQKFRYFDYGPLRNLFHYNKTVPPEHKVDRLEVQNWLLISGSLDTLGDSLTIQRIKELTWTPKPPTHIIAPGFSHLDMLAAVEVEAYVNRPFIQYLDQHSTKSSRTPLAVAMNQRGNRIQPSSVKVSLDLSKGRST